MTDAPQHSLPKFAAPPGACDTHIHIYGPKDRYRVLPTAPVEPPLALVSDYRKVMRRLGIDRVVIVQPSAYGTDNACTLDAMAEFGDRARGVAVIDRDVSDAELAGLNMAGVRGARFFMLKGGVIPWESLEPVAARIQEHGWHIQLQMDGRDLQERLAQLKRLPGTLVIDHTGKFLEPVDIDHPGFRALLDLVQSGRVWVKLSAPYETSKAGPPHYMDVGGLAQALIKAAPERMVWASNWPHPSAQAAPPDDAVLLDVLRHWSGDDALTRRILADNPAALYGFPAPALARSATSQ